MSIPFSHSLLMDTVWALLFDGAYFLARRHVRGAWIIVAAALSHWVLDVVTDRPLVPWMETRLGLGLWNSPIGTLIVEGAIWFAAIAVYVRGTRPKGRAGRYGFWPVIAILTFLWLTSPKAIRQRVSRHWLSSTPSFFAVVLSWTAWMNKARPVSAP